MGYAQLAGGIRDLASSSPMSSKMRLVFQIRKYFEVSTFVLVSLGHSFTEKYDKFATYVNSTIVSTYEIWSPEIQSLSVEELNSLKHPEMSLRGRSGVWSLS